MHKSKKLQEHVSALKESLKSYKTNPFDRRPAKVVTTGVEACSKIIQRLLKAPEQENQKFHKFVETKLIKKWNIFIDQLHDKIQARNEKKTKATTTTPLSAISVLKEDIQVFGLLFENVISQEKAFQYPLTIRLLNLASSDGLSRQQKNKATLCNQIIKDFPKNYRKTHPPNSSK